MMVLVNSRAAPKESTSSKATTLQIGSESLHFESLAIGPTATTDQERQEQDPKDISIGEARENRDLDLCWEELCIAEPDGQAPVV
jgi:hypothetical protein